MWSRSTLRRRSLSHQRALEVRQIPLPDRHPTAFTRERVLGDKCKQGLLAKHLPVLRIVRASGNGSIKRGSRRKIQVDDGVTCGTMQPEIKAGVIVGGLRIEAFDVGFQALSVGIALQIGPLRKLLDGHIRENGDTPTLGQIRQVGIRDGETGEGPVAHTAFRGVGLRRQAGPMCPEDHSQAPPTDDRENSALVPPFWDQASRAYPGSGPQDRYPGVQKTALPVRVVRCQ